MRIVRTLTLMSIAGPLGMLAIGVAMLFDARQDAWNEAAQAAENLSLVMEREIGRSFASYDLSINGSVTAMAIPGIDTASPDLRHAAVFDKASRAEHLGMMGVIDSHGNVILESHTMTPPALNVADREFFQVHRDRPNVGLFISRPLVSRLNKDPIIALSRRRAGPDGAFAGVVVGAMRLAYFQDMFATLNFGASGSVTLLRDDGRVLAHHPANGADIDADLSRAPAFKTLSAASHGQFVGTSAMDGQRRLFTFRHIGDLPLIIDIGMSVDEIYAPWRHKAIVIGAILGGLGSAIALLGQLFRHEIQRRINAEGDLIKAARELSTLAITDGLTTLDNRRSFEAKLAAEWQRALRGGSPLCLLMIDADNFKLYNDTHGHQAGDQALRDIATCIRQSIRAVGDSGARYGGEEFAVILPSTPIAGAARVAGRIQAAIAARDIAHGLSPTGRVTVSIGVALARHDPEDTAETLVKQADDALYQAKQTGRNRICLADPSATVAVA